MVRSHPTMSTRALALLLVGLAAPLGLDACSAPVFPARPADAGPGVDLGVIEPGDDAPVPPDDRPVVPGEDVPAGTDRGAVDRPVAVPDAGPPPDVGTNVTCNVSASVARAVPAFNEATLARVRAIRAAGIARGNRPQVFTKIGDSITEAAGFLQDYGFGYETDFGRYACLRATVAYFVSATFSDGNNSFNHPSASAMGGWLSSQPLLGDPDSPLRAELNITRPLYGIVMIGTNDLASGTLSGYMANLTRILTVMEDFGTVPVVSTIPDRDEDARFAPLVTSFNDAIRALAASRNLPLIDYWVVMHDLPSHGLDTTDGIHPSIFRDMGDAQGRQLTDAALQYGYNMRNLTALLMLERLRALPQ
ncbi:MAG: multifunctional acyl-CoA thioesterase and protease and lysophospholipase [Myxococcaceae bacterium]|nr:multifunctional acyl-CoA thioesterase and protease and lysophospholipase [Myxococcaceae bacterium]